MSAKLHQSFAANKLDVRNRTSGEVILYVLDPAGEKKYVVVYSDRKKVVNLLEEATLDAWKKSPSLAQAVTSGRLDVVL